MRTNEYKIEKMQKFNFYFALILMIALMILMNYNLFAQDGTEWGISASYLKNNTHKFINVEKQNLPLEFKIYQNFPNPCYKNTSIKFDISTQTDAKLIIFDKSGTEIKSYIYSNIKPGSYEINVDASMLEPGNYTYKFSAGSYTDEYSMTVVK